MRRYGHCKYHGLCPGCSEFDALQRCLRAGIVIRPSSCCRANGQTRRRSIREENQTPDILTRDSFFNAITILQAIGGSTNAVVHLLAIIGRHPKVAATITLDTFDEIGRRTPLLVDLKPSGDNYMTDFHNSGGMLALLHELKPLLHLDALTISGRTLGQEIAAAPFHRVSQDGLFHCMQPFTEPLYPSSSIVVLHGNLAPQGAVMKASASKDRRLLKHTGPAVVFSNSADLARRIDDPDLDVGPDSVLVLQNIGPRGHPGMPEAGLIPIPRKLARQGVQDMLRLSDGRDERDCWGDDCATYFAGGSGAGVSVGDCARWGSHYV